MGAETGDFKLGTGDGDQGLGTGSEDCKLWIGSGTEYWDLVPGSRGTGPGDGTLQPLRFRGAERGVGRGSAAGRKGLGPAGGRKSWQSYSSG